MHRPPLRPLRAPRSPAWVLVALGAYVAAAAIWFSSPSFPREALRAVQAATDGWITVTLLASLGIGLGQLLLLFGPGRQTPRSVGWRARDLAPAAAALALLWAAMHLGTFAVAARAGSPPALDPAWQAGGRVPGALLAQLLGTALIEETVFRGYLWGQLRQRLERHLQGGMANAVALAGSQAAFALLHVPLILMTGASPAAAAGTVLLLFATGLVLGLMYAGTGNLFFVVAVHALGNAPSLLVVPQGPAPTLLLLVAASVIAAVARRRRRPRLRTER